MIQFGNKEAASITIGGKEVQKIEIGGKTAYEKETIDYFYIENIGNGSNTLTLTTTMNGTPSGSDYSDTVEYSKDKTNWTTVTFDTTTPTTISMDQGDKVYFRNNNGKFNFRSSLDSSQYYYTQISSSESHSAGGNIMSLLDYTNMSSTTLTKSGCFFNLFQNDSNLSDISDLKLPATTLIDKCYQNMFWGTGITTIPSNFLPATTMTLECYQSIFRGCASLTTIPSDMLPATTLANYCYRYAFLRSSNLRNAPDLPATILVSDCYSEMFSGCTSLNSITIYANDISASNCLSKWVNGVSATGTFYNNGSATYPRTVSGIPTGWTEDTSNRFVFSNTVITNVGNNQAQLTSGIQVNYTGSWDDGYFEVYNELDKDRSIHFSPSDISNGVLTASNLITESNVATLVSPATVTIYNSGTAVWTGSVSFTVVQ